MTKLMMMDQRRPRPLAIGEEMRAPPTAPAWKTETTLEEKLVT
jgi:hypothetical protein